MSKSSRLILLVTFVILAASVASRFTATSHADFLGNLNGNVGPGFSISLTTADGTPVTSLGAGTYAIHVNDQASNHNFHLEGLGREHRHRHRRHPDRRLDRRPSRRLVHLPLRPAREPDGELSPPARRCRAAGTPTR